MGSFNSLQIAKSGLYVSQKALDVTANNIANVNTEGYSRQRLEVASTPSINHGTVEVGRGVTIEQIGQIRDKYLDTQFRNENALSQELNLKSSSLEYIEGIMSEPSDYGLNASLAELFNALDDLSNSAEEPSLREVVIQKGIHLTDTFRTISGSLVDYQDDIDSSIALQTAEVNSLGEQIKEINQTIASFEYSGFQANDLRDQRNGLLDSLSSIIPISTQETADGQFKVKTAGVLLVDNVTVNKLEIRASENRNPYTGVPVNDVYWADSNTQADIRGGKLKGLLDMRDGNTEENQGVPYFLQALDGLANEIIEGFNAINKAGYTLPYQDHPSVSGVDFFNADIENCSALNIRLSDELLENSYNIATSSRQLSGELNWGNNENVIKFNEFRNTSNIEAHLQGSISDLAITTSYFRNRNESQQNLTNFIESQKLSVSGVSIDEEMTNLLQYQHSYNAAAKVITAIDEMLGVLINM